MVRASERKKGHFDRAESGRPGQTRLEDPCLVRPCGSAARAGGLRRQHPRQSSPQAPGQSYTGGEIPARTTPRTTGKLHADKAYDIAELRTWLRGRSIVPRIARKGIESSEKLGQHRWVIERSIAWLFGYRRLTSRYEVHAHLFCAFLTLAAALTCYKKLAKSK
jgi:hypothetical protein